MRTRVAVAVVCGLVFSAGLAADEKSDQDKIQGKWQMESGMRGGKALPDENVKNTVIVIDGNKMKFTRTVDGKEQTREMTFKLDASKKPKTIDVDIEGKPGLGIYTLDGDTLKICHGEQGDERPTELSSKEGSKVTVVVLKRVK